MSFLNLLTLRGNIGPAGQQTYRALVITCTAAATTATTTTTNTTTNSRTTTNTITTLW